MNRANVRTCITAGWALLALTLVSPALDYYVAPTGSDGASGTKASPFKTIQAAVDRAKPGDICHVASGIYRETVKPKASGTRDRPITIKASEADAAIICGTEPVRGWVNHSGSVYKAKMPWSMRKNNQVFFDGKPLQEARWPDDSDGDPMTPDGAKIGGGDVDHILCPRFPADWQAGDLEGAVVWAIAGSSWSSWTTTVSDYDAPARKVSFPSFKGNWWVESRHNPKSKRGTFYLVGAMKLLDSPGEWFYDEEAKTLFLWPPHNEDPNKHRVEAKARLLGLDLSNRSSLVVDGINLLGCSLDMGKSSYCRVANMKAHHIFHTRGGKTMSGIGEKSGIFMSGHHNRLENCEIAYSAGSGISLGGADSAVVNCWIHHIDYIGAYCSPIFMSGMRHLISHNTIAYTGRDCIKLGGAEHLIQFNDLGYPGRICHDLGVVYSGGLDGGNTRIRYNFVHDNPDAAGIYLDNYMDNYIIDHNVIWNLGNCIRLNRPTGFCMVLNNTVFGDINNLWGPWKGQRVQWGCHVMNNLCSGKIKMNPEVVMSANMTSQDLNGSFNTVTRSRGNLNPGKGAGVPIAGITPSASVDVGAFQHDAPAWRAGHDFKNRPNPRYTTVTEPLRNHIRNAAFEYSHYYRETPEKSDPLVHWTPTQAATTVEVKHHGGFNTPPANARDSVHGNSVTLGGDGDSGIQQKVNDLKPNTTYCFSGYVKHAGDLDVEFSVALAGRAVATASSQNVKLAAGQTWRIVLVSFSTGPTDNSATVTIIKRGAGKAFVDDTGLVPARYGLQAKHPPAGQTPPARK